MALAVVSEMPSNGGFSSASASWNYNFTCAAGSTLLLVGVETSSNSAQTTDVTSVSYNGVAMTLVPNGSASFATTACRLKFYYLLNPPTGSSLSVAIVWTTNGGTSDCISGAITFSGNDATTPFRSTTFSASGNSAGPATVDVTGTTVGNICVDLAGTGATGGFSGRTNTLSWVLAVSGSNAGDNAESTRAAGSGGTVTVSHTLPAADSWGVLAIEIQADTGGGPTSQRPVGPMRSGAGSNPVRRFRSPAAGVSSSFDPSVLPWPALLPGFFARPAWNPERSDSTRAGWTQSTWAIAPAKIPEPSLPERFARLNWNPERSAEERAGWTQALWAIAPQKIPEPVLPEGRLVPWNPERSHSVGIPYLRPTWPTTVVAPERFARAPWTPERSETPRAGWTQSLWAVPPTFIPEPVLPQAFPRIWNPERSQAVWNPLQIFVVPTWAYEVYGPQALLRTAWNPERSHLSRAAWTQALWAVPPTKTPDPVLPEFYARPGWFPDRGQTLWNPFQFAAVTVPVWGYEVLGPQAFLRGSWNPERSGLVRAGWTQALWAVAPTKIPEPLLPESFPRLWNPERSALAWVPFSTIPVFGYEVHGPQVFLRALWNPERGDLARAGWTQSLWAVAPTKIPEPVLPSSFARQIWTPERSHHSSVPLILPRGVVPNALPERFPPFWIPERTAVGLARLLIVPPLSWEPHLLERFVKALRASPNLDLFAPSLTTVIIPVFGAPLFGRQDSAALLGQADLLSLSGKQDVGAVSGKQDGADLLGEQDDDDVKGKVS